jgi:hypothetical protein
VRQIAIRMSIAQFLCALISLTLVFLLVTANGAETTSTADTGKPCERCMAEVGE